MYALVDCNSFYCSCETVFRPDLDGRPVVVLSNNDGCLIALNTAAKGLGLKMGTPYFEARAQIERDGVAVFSSNYELYGDLSRRVMSVLGTFSPVQEVYSIDECFLDLTGFCELDAYARRIRDTVQQWTGIPVSIGIGPTKTLAKAANKLAKNHPSAGGVWLLETRPRWQADLAGLQIEDVWGVGRRWSKRLQQHGIHTADELRRADPVWIARTFNVVLERTARELNGQKCIELDLQPQPKQQIVVSRSFGQAVTDIESLRESISTHMTRAAEKLRSAGLTVPAFQVFAHTNAFKPHDPQYHGAATITLPYPTQDTRLLVRAATAGLKRLFKEGYSYKKAGVMLIDLRPPGLAQIDMFAGAATNQDDERSGRLMGVMDQINRRMGRGKIFLASQGGKQSRGDWKLRRELRSPSYTTSWLDLAVVK